MSRRDESHDFVAEDGLLYCGICGKHRQLRLANPLFGERIVMTMCKCDEAEEAAKKAAQAAEDARDRVKRLRAEGMSSPDYAAMVFSADDGRDGRLFEMQTYVNAWERAIDKNAGLLFFGPVDGGKTFWAACIANALMEKGVSALITTVPNLIAAMHSDFDGARARILEKISTVSFLVLDDVGYERRTQYADEKLFEIIDARYRAKKPLIVTTNLSLDEMRNPSDMAYQRAFGRIIEMCTPIFFPAVGRRVQIARAKAEVTRKIMGG